MSKHNFPIFGTKIKGVTQKFDINDPKERQKYFEAKAGKEIAKIRDYLKNNTFIAYMLAKKSAGKGTYSKLFREAIGSDRIVHLSVGDLVRDLDAEVRDEKKRAELIKYLQEHYRGYHPIDDIISAQLNRDTKTLLPTEFILALIKREIDKLERKAIFIDGFPRNMDQVSYSLFFRNLIDYRQDPDFFVLIDVPEAVIEERLKFRRVCPKCHSPRNIKLLPTKFVGFDKKTQEYYLMCDEPGCHKARMVKKEGDELGLEPIRKRLDIDGALIDKAFSLHGVDKVLLRNAVPVEQAKQFNDYEITPEFSFEGGKNGKQIRMIERPWIIKDDQGIDCYSLMAPPVVVAMIKQVADLLG